jgi:molybdopterin converting factor small subunit
MRTPPDRHDQAELSGESEIRKVGMRIIVKFSSLFKTLSGVDLDTVDVSNGSTIEQMTKILRRKYQDLPFDQEQTFYLVNDKVSKRDQVLKEGDQVMIFQMFAGG